MEAEHDFSDTNDADADLSERNERGDCGLCDGNPKGDLNLAKGEDESHSKLGEINEPDAVLANGDDSNGKLAHTHKAEITRGELTDAEPVVADRGVIVVKMEREGKEESEGNPPGNHHYYRSHPEANLLALSGRRKGVNVIGRLLHA